MQRLRTRLRASASTGAPPSLSLDFLGLNQTLDSRVTFSRGSNATLVDSTGKVTYAPNNLLLRSEEFDNAAWTKDGVTIAANSTAAPDGTLTADTLADTTANAGHLVYESAASITSGTTYTFSVFAKASTATVIQVLGRSGTMGANVWANFNLSNGTIGSVGSSTTASITDFGGGWYRCIVTGTATGTGTGAFALSLTNNSTTALRSPTYIGTGTGTFIWGAQLEAVTYQTTPSTYNATTASAYYGPRFDYDPVTLNPKGLLIEEQRTNLLTYSGQFDNASWTKIGTTVSANAATSPDGTADADSLVEDSATSDHRVNQPSISAGSGANTFSVYLKAGSRTFARIQFDGTISAVASSAGVDVNLSTGATGSTAVVGNISAASVAVTNVGNGWYRVALTATLSASGTLAARVFIMQSIGGSTSYTGNGSGNILLYGAQLEAGAFATSYIPTVASTVTRSADVATMTGTNFSSWYNQSEGTIFASVDTVAPTGSPVLSFQDGAGASTNRHQMNIYSSFTATVVSSVTQSNIGTNTNTSPKLVYAYKANDFAACANGAAVAVDTSGTVPTTLAYATLGKWDFGSAASLNGHIRRLAYYPTRLADYQLQGLTA